MINEINEDMYKKWMNSKKMQINNCRNSKKIQIKSWTKSEKQQDMKDEFYEDIEIVKNTQTEIFKMESLSQIKNSVESHSNRVY
jgi:hypothetical protein